MKNVRLKVLAILSVILIALLVVSQKVQISVTNNGTGLAVHVYNKQKKADSITNSLKRKTPKENIEATVGINGLKIREQPSLSSRVVGIFNSGTKININHEKAGWSQIQTPSGVEGWVSTKDIARSNETQPVIVTTTSIVDIQEPLKGKTIVLDPGHGGNDHGTTSIVGTYEKTLTLSTAQVVKQKLENAGAIVYMTRTNDTYIPLTQRAQISNQNHADAFISFHYNCYHDSSMNGLTDFYYQKSKDNTLATDILNEVVKSTGLHNVGTRFDDLEVLRNNTQPSTLIELGFLSSNHDDPIVESPAYRDQVAEGVYQGLLDYFSSKK